MGTTHLSAAPAGNSLVTANVREVGKAALSRVFAGEAVGSVRAADNVHAAAGVIVTGVVADYMESALEVTKYL